MHLKTMLLPDMLICVAGTSLVQKLTIHLGIRSAMWQHDIFRFARHISCSEPCLEPLTQASQRGSDNAQLEAATVFVAVACASTGVLVLVPDLGTYLSASVRLLCTPNALSVL